MSEFEQILQHLKEYLKEEKKEKEQLKKENIDLKNKIKQISELFNEFNDSNNAIIAMNPNNIDNVSARHKEMKSFQEKFDKEYEDIRRTPKRKDWGEDYEAMCLREGRKPNYN